MSDRIRVLSVVLILTADVAMSQEQSRRWEPLPAGMVLTRNFMAPETPEKDGYQLLPEKYRLGTKAYAKVLPAWWLKIVDEAKISNKWHPKDFPLAYAGEFETKTGRVLLVVQASHAFSGDGFFTPGPEVYLVARVFSTGDAGLKLVKEQSFRLRSMQYTRLMAGKATGREIEFQTEGAQQFDSRKPVYKKNWILTLGDDGSLSIQEGELVFLRTE